MSSFQCYIRAASALHASGFSSKALSCLSIAKTKCSTSNSSNESLLSRIESLTSEIEGNPNPTSKSIKKSKIEVQDPSSKLPPEIFAKVLYILDQSSRIKSTEVSKDWRNLSLESSALWRELEFIRSRWNFSTSTFGRVLNYSRGTLKSIHVDLPISFWNDKTVEALGSFKRTLETVCIDLRDSTSQIGAISKLARTLRECPRLKSLSFHNNTSSQKNICATEELFEDAKFQKLSILSLKDLSSSGNEYDLEGLLSDHLDELKEYSVSRADSLEVASTYFLIELLRTNKESIEKVESQVEVSSVQAKDISIIKSSSEASIFKLESELELPFLKDLKLETMPYAGVQFKLEAVVSTFLMPSLSNFDFSFLPSMSELAQFFLKLSENAPNLKTLKLNLIQCRQEEYREGEVITSMRNALQQWKQLESFTFQDGGFVVKTKPILNLLHNSYTPSEPLICPRLKEINVSSVQEEAVGEVISEAVKLVASRLKAAGLATTKTEQDVSSSTSQSKSLQEPRMGAFSRASSNNNNTIKSKGAFSTPASSKPSTSSSKSSGSIPENPLTSALSNSNATLDPNSTSVPIVALHLPKVDFQSIDQKALDWLRSKLEIVTFSPPPTSRSKTFKATATRGTRGERVWSGGG